MFIKSMSWNNILILLLLLPQLAFVLVYFLQNPTNIHLPCLSTNGCSAELSKSPSDIKLLIGIHTIAKKYQRRNLIRMAYAVQQPVQNAQLDIRFVLCNLTSHEDKVLVSLEIITHHDIIILDCLEKADEGKTYTYFSSLPGMFPGELLPYDYVMKTDDDMYLRLDKVVQSLKNKPRNDAYWGAGLPFDNEGYTPFMLGMGYMLSWDLVEWIATSEIPRNEPTGPEDVLTGDWLNTGGKGNNRYNMYPNMYDFDYMEEVGPQAFPDTVGVHQLKLEERWVSTLERFERFNTTERLQPSPFYHF